MIAIQTHSLDTKPQLLFEVDLRRFLVGQVRARINSMIQETIQCLEIS